jgi:hypothetical protein
MNNYFYVTIIYRFAYCRPEYQQLKLLSINTEKFPDNQTVTIDALYRVFHHGERQRGDTHRFAQTEDPEDFMSYVIF